ncbi:MAG: Sec-independent protein translocase protein TatB [Gammaproteobacteria bacterium]|jgi:sec-independent protein translocase protein TatB|nr:Sec-independent protein translocase protein TatB [Gammaproteobacteria bacterium]
MFDIGFWELAIIGVVALIVIGPDKLPAVARTVGYWLGKGRRFVATVQDDINREVSKADELKRLLEEQSKIKEMHEIIEHTVDETKKTVSIGAPLNKSENKSENKLENTSNNKPAADQAESEPGDTQPDQAKLSSTPSANDSLSNGSKPTPAADQVNEQTK